MKGYAEETQEILDQERIDKIRDLALSILKGRLNVAEKISINEIGGDYHISLTVKIPKPEAFLEFHRSLSQKSID